MLMRTKAGAEADDIRYIVMLIVVTNRLPLLGISLLAGSTVPRPPAHVERLCRLMCPWSFVCASGRTRAGELAPAA